MFDLQFFVKKRNKRDMAGAVDTHLALHGVNFESFNHTNTILKGLNDLRMKGCLFDITLKVEDKSFKV